MAFLSSYKCVPYIPIAEARGFTAHSGNFSQDAALGGAVFICEWD